MTSWQWLFEHGCLLRISPLPDPSWTLCPWAKSLHGHSSCLINSSHSDRCCFLCFFVYRGSSVPIETCSDAQSIQLDILAFCFWGQKWYPQVGRLPVPGSLSLIMRKKHPSPWTQRGSESRVTKKSLGSVKFLTYLHFFHVSRTTIPKTSKIM